MINFKLGDYNEIHPMGEKPNQYLSWYWSTYGEIWLSFGETTIYEYSEQAISYFGTNRKYNEYFLVQFLNDFLPLCNDISESVPEWIFKLTNDFPEFLSDTDKWLNIYEKEEDKEHSEFYFEEYHDILKWLYERSFTSIELIGGPSLFFIRHKEKIRICWLSEETLENDISIWTAKNGSFEMNYKDFTDEVFKFGQNFFKAMKNQINSLLSKDWTDVSVKKEKLYMEHEAYKKEFDESYNFLISNRSDVTDWNKIEQLYKRMKLEIT